MKAENRSTDSISMLFPVFLLLIAGLAVSLTLLLGGMDLTVTSLIIVVPLVLASAILLIRRNAGVGSLALPDFAGKLRFSHLFLFNLGIFIVSIMVLVTEDIRPLSYFILLAVFSGVLFWQIITRRPAWTDGLIIFEISLLSLNLIWGTAMKYPLYFGDTDTLVHLNMIETILESAHVSPNIYYQHYPLYHIFTAAGVEITGVSTRTVLFVFMGLAWQAGILFAFLIFRNLAQSNKLALVACLIFASSSQLIFYGSYAIARSLAFVFLLCWLYLIFNRAQRNTGFLFLSVIVLIMMIMTHHVNVMYAIPVLLLVLVCQLFVIKDKQKWLVNPQFIYLMIIGCIAYLVWGAFDMSREILPGTVRSILDTKFNMVGDFTRGYGLSVLLGAVYYSFILLLCFLGMKFILQYMNVTASAFTAGTFATAAFFLLVLYVPGPLDMLSVSEIALTYRFPLIVSPFVAFLAALGVLYVYSTRGTLKFGFARTRYMSAVLVFFIAGMTFLSAISTGNAKDSIQFPHTSTIADPFFTEAELTSYSFLSVKADNKMPLYADYETIRNEFQFSDFADRNILQGGDISSITAGYLVLRKGELERKKALTFLAKPGTGQTYRYFQDAAEPGKDILLNLESKDRIYSSKAIQAFFISASVP